MNACSRVRCTFEKLHKGKAKENSVLGRAIKRASYKGGG
jgi:hypothetical protein